MIKNLTNLQARAEAMSDIYKVAMLSPTVTVAFATDIKDALDQAQKMQYALASILAMCHEAKLDGEPEPAVYADTLELTIKTLLEEA